MDQLLEVYLHNSFITGGQGDAGDRFVPQRAGVDHKAIRSWMFSDRSYPSSDEDEIFLQQPELWRLRDYRRALISECGASSTQPLLKLTLGRTNSKLGPRDTSPPGWACAPRRRAVILVPDVIFDLPGFEENMNCDILDWGRRDYLVAGLGEQIYMLETSTNHVTQLHTFDSGQDSVLVVKWDPLGVLIAIGTRRGQLFMYDTNVQKMFPISQREMFSSSLTSLAWDPNGVQLACGNSAGTLILLDMMSKKIFSERCKAHDRCIINCSYSPNGQFLVTCGSDGNVRIWNLPELRPFFQIVFAHPARALAWHPWRSCLLAVGGGFGQERGHGDGSLSVWNVSLQHNVCYHLSRAPCAVESMAWSQLTGELVVSYWIEGQTSGHDESMEGHSRILVLSAPTKVTDELYSPHGRTKVLLFNPDGTKIASASTDENLSIWSFLGSNGPLLTKHKRKIEKRNMIYNINEINQFNNFGITIR